MEKNCIGTCPCQNIACPRHGNCVECIAQHRNTPPVDIVACQREKAREVYGSKQE